MSENRSTSPVWRYERKFEFALPIARVWSLFTDPLETRAWLLPFEDHQDGDRVATIEGKPPIKMSVERFEPPKLMRIAMSGGNMPGHVETSTELAETASGTKATLVHEGFGDTAAWEVFGNSFSLGWDEATTDLMLYVHTGIKNPRHIADKRASIAAWPVRREWGIELVEVFPGGFADQAGMKAGDILLKLDRMGIYQVADVWAFTRVRSAGEEAEAEYIRGRELRKGRGRISRFEDFGE
ncbi:MAG TPA: SRPBCC domain-containing protein [Candidatus Binataceae bacterium]|nr:SRPBCC domain-containing protein [Candidatus Binataceae bacterium]